jgi:flagellar export protein FliJ
MRRFRFPLRGVLRLRGHAERAARQQLGVTLRRLEAAEQRLHNVEQGLRECHAVMGGTSPAVSLAVALGTALKRLHLRAEAETRGAQAAVEQSRTEYLQRRSELRSIRSLHDRRRAEWQQAALSAEQAELDELARLGRAAREREEVST